MFLRFGGRLYNVTEKIGSVLEVSKSLKLKMGDDKKLKGKNKR